MEKLTTGSRSMKALIHLPLAGIFVKAVVVTPGYSSGRGSTRSSKVVQRQDKGWSVKKAAYKPLIV